MLGKTVQERFAGFIKDWNEILLGRIKLPVVTLDWLLVHLKPNRWMAIENDRKSMLDEAGD